MEVQNLFDKVSKEKFGSVANRLLGECFILKKHKDTVGDYNYVINHKEAYQEFFGYLGFELIIDEANGVVGLNNPSGVGRIQLKKFESVLLLILRLLYLEKRKQLSQTSDVIIIADEIYEKYELLKMNARIERTSMKNAMGMFQRYRLINKLDYDMSNPSTRIIIYPSIMFAVTNKSLDEMYDIAKEKLEKIANGGDLEDAGCSQEAEEANED